MGNVLRFREEDLIDYIVSFMGKLEVPGEDAKIVGDVLVEADIRGINLHGLIRLTAL